MVDARDYSPRFAHGMRVSTLWTRMADPLTRVTIWLALAFFAVAQLCRRRTAASPRIAFKLFFVGFSLFLAHVLLAFQVHYGWSHATALVHTATQTEALVGIRSGSGLYLNYLFGGVWMTELGWWHRSELGYRSRAGWIEHTVCGFFLFMIVNGAVVFVEGWSRWLGVAVTALLLWAWRPEWESHRGPSAGDSMPKNRSRFGIPKAHRPSSTEASGRAPSSHSVADRGGGPRSRTASCQQ